MLAYKMLWVSDHRLIFSLYSLNKKTVIIFEGEQYYVYMSHKWYHENR